MKANRPFKFNVQTFDKEGNVINDDNFRSIKEIADNYKNIPYGTIYYIAHYDESKTKPSKKISSILQRFQITHLDDDDTLFEKAKQ